MRARVEETKDTVHAIEANYKVAFSESKKERKTWMIIAGLAKQRRYGNRKKFQN